MEKIFKDATGNEAILRAGDVATLNEEEKCIKFFRPAGNLKACFYGEDISPKRNEKILFHKIVSLIVIDTKLSAKVTKNYDWADMEYTFH